MCLQENLERKIERIYLENAPKLPNFFLITEGIWVIYNRILTFWI